MKEEELTNEARVTLAFEGKNFNPNEFTKIIGIEPDLIRIKDSRRLGVPRFNTWQISTDKIIADYIDIFEMANEVIDRIKDKKAIIIESRKQIDFDLTMSVYIRFSLNDKHSTPAIGFDSDAVKFLAEVGASIDIDTYLQPHD
ncbi:MAG: DUF4279 domain-containing protein [Pseudobacteriovorax sp.]|nr:DUF4279 domain-containing protein [Pseudobacteriovorax sp.]